MRILVSIPTYNYGRFVGDAIKSVLEQTYADFTLNVYDNASIDNTEEVVIAFSDDRLHYIKRPENIGSNKNFTEALRQDYDIIKWLCADDVIEPTYLEKTVGVLEECPNVGLVTCGRQIVDENLNPLGSTWGYTEGSGVYKGKDVIRKCMGGNFIGEPSAVIFRRTLMDRDPDPSFLGYGDMLAWFCVLEKSDMYYIDEPLCKFRQHENQDSKYLARTGISASDLPRIQEMYRRYLT